MPGIWIFQILCWASLIFSLVIYIGDNEQVGIFGAFGACYIVYIILEFCSPTSRYLCNKSSDQGMYEKMGRNFQTPPEIRFYCECYHYENVVHTRTNSEGKKKLIQQGKDVLLIEKLIIYLIILKEMSVACFI